MPWQFNIDSDGHSPERAFIISESKRAWGYESPFPDIQDPKEPKLFRQIFANLRIRYEDSRTLSNDFVEMYGKQWSPSSNDSEDKYCKNPSFNLSFPEYDAFVLDSMIRTYKPRRILELGSGQSTRVMTSIVSELQLETRITCIDRYAGDKVKNSLQRMKVDFEEIDITELNPAVLCELQQNDIFFIDSSHVLKNFGDVEFIYNYLFPLIPRGVIVHVHDIFLPYNYPSAWIIDWKSVLTEQQIFGSWLDNRHEVQVLAANFWNLMNGVAVPESLEHRVGGSFWFRVNSS